jgi:hypothetical protein
VRFLAAIAIGILTALVGYYLLPSVFWDHGPYVFSSDRLEGAIVSGIFASAASLVLSDALDSDGGSRAILIWLGLAVIGAVWVLLQFTSLGR